MQDSRIENAVLCDADIPPPSASYEIIAAFALTFDGYTKLGSFEACAEVANSRRHNSLTDLRTCLFFEQRRWHHFGDVPDGETMSYLHGLLDQIRARLVAGDRG